MPLETAPEARQDAQVSAKGKDSQCTGATHLACLTPNTYPGFLTHATIAKLPHKTASIHQLLEAAPDSWKPP
eukprot:2297282-Pleurochrysis_carterae.AAC.1